MQEYKVLITTSGTGSRLGDLTKFTNKSLVKIGKKPAISYIVESYDKDIELVITVGYFKEHVVEFLNLCYPERKITFVDIDNYDKEGSSLLYSILKAKDHLQCPFIFHACDTIILDKIEKPDCNWLLGYKGNDSSNYRSFNEVSGIVDSINEKNCNGFDYLYVGLAGIKDYDLFWEEAENIYLESSKNSQLSDCHVIDNLLDRIVFFPKECKQWFDIGNLEDLNFARENIYDKFNILDKVDESIFLFDNFVIKFFSNKEIVKNRLERTKVLKDITPKILGCGENFYKYEFIQGELLSNVANEVVFEEFLKWSKTNLWKKQECGNFQNLCYDFYISKTKKRIKKLLDENNIIDKIDNINGIDVPSISDLLNELDQDFICNGFPCIMHGDYILDNILKTNDGFKLLDWRQDFAGNVKVGDLYYDLGKLNHNLTFNHDIVNKGLYTYTNISGNINVDILISYNLSVCKDILKNFCILNGFNYKKVNIMSSIIWLNMSPLHEYPLNLFLFYFGKYNLYKNLETNVCF